MATVIPGIDVVETPWNSDASRAFARDPGPGNPNFNSATSPERAAFERAQAARPAGLSAAGPQAAPQGSALFRAGARGAEAAMPAVKAAASGLQSVGAAGVRTLGNSIKAGGGGVISAGLALGDIVGNRNMLDDENVPWQDRARVGAAGLVRGAAPMIAAPIGAGAGSVVPVAGTALGGLAGAAVGGYIGDKLGDMIAPPDVYTRNGYQPGGVMTLGSGGARTPEFMRGASASAPGQDVAQVRKLDDQMAGAAPALDPNASSMGPPGWIPAAQQARDLSAGGPEAAAAAPGVSARDTADAEALRAMGAQSLASQRGGLSIIDPSADRQKFFDQADLRNAMNRTRTDRRGNVTMDPSAALLAGQIQARQRADIEAARTAAGRDINAANNETARRGQDTSAGVARAGQQISLDNALRQDETTRRGQDITERGQDVNARTAAAQARIAQYNADRTYAAGRSDAEFNQADKRREAVTKQIEGLIPPGADGKPDTATTSRVMGEMNNMVAQRQRELEAQLAKTPDRADVKAGLEQLKKDPYSALDQERVRRLIVGSRVAQTAQQNATGSFIPWGATAAKSTAPVVSLAPESSWLGTDYKATRADGSKDVIPKRYLSDFEQDLGILTKR